jgi:hypothetical protein
MGHVATGPWARTGLKMTRGGSERSHLVGSNQRCPGRRARFSVARVLSASPEQSSLAAQQADRGTRAGDASLRTGLVGFVPTRAGGANLHLI